MKTWRRDSVDTAWSGAMTTEGWGRGGRGTWMGGGGVGEGDMDEWGVCWGLEEPCMINIMSIIHFHGLGE